MNCNDELSDAGIIGPTIQEMERQLSRWLSGKKSLSKRSNVLQCYRQKVASKDALKTAPLQTKDAVRLFRLHKGRWPTKQEIDKMTKPVKYGTVIRSKQKSGGRKSKKRKSRKRKSSTRKRH